MSAESIRSSGENSGLRFLKYIVQVGKPVFPTNGDYPPVGWGCAERVFNRICITCRIINTVRTKTGKYTLSGK